MRGVLRLGLIGCLTVVQAQAADPKNYVLETTGQGTATVIDVNTGEMKDVIVSPEGKPENCSESLWWTDTQFVVSCGTGTKYQPKYGAINLYAKGQLPLEETPGTNDPGPSREEDPPEGTP